ncbi:MAG: thiolase family protein [Lentisphaeraceae bacterium]|nr:thiolase family protein [Lentisphaeraceae bacterium]
MREAVIVSCTRTAIGKAFKGSLTNTRPDELMATVLKSCIEDSKIDPEVLEDIIVGCAMPQDEQGMNLGRIALLKAGFPVSVPGMTINRFCSSGLQSIALACERIVAGGADAIIAGGVESMSMVNFLTGRMHPDAELYAESPNCYLSMGVTSENVAKQYGISRTECDQFALESNQKAGAAIASGRFKDEITPITVKSRKLGADGKVKILEKSFDTDEGPRPNSTLEGLGKLRPAFNPKGGVSTAGNSSQVSDGAAAVLVTSREFAESHGLPIMATFRGFQVAGVPPEVMGIGPSFAVPKLMKKANKKISDLNVIELNEAFATQSIAVMRDLELNKDIVNPNGGAIALGHPLGCTGAKLTVSAIHEAQKRGGGLALVTMCIGGGMGAAGLFEV